MKALMASFGWILLCAGTAFGQEALWSYTPPSGFVDTSPGIGDINEDGVPEIILGTTSGLVVAIDAAGKELWQQGMVGHFCFPPTVANVTGDALPEVVAMNELGQIFCLKGSTGEKIWDTTLPGRSPWGTTAPAAADVDGDGGLEIVVGTESGMVICVRGTGGGGLDGADLVSQSTVSRHRRCGWRRQDGSSRRGGGHGSGLPLERGERALACGRGNRRQPVCV